MNESLKKGLRAGTSLIPSFVPIFIGFGIAARVADVPIAGVVALTVAIFAAPAQLAMLDLAGQGAAAIIQMIFASTLVNLRFFLMSLTLSQLFKQVPRRRLLLSAQFVTASTFLLTFFQSRKDAKEVDSYDFFTGVIVIGFSAAVAGTVIGIALGAGLHPALAFGATLFLPIYFALLLAGDVKGRFETAAVLFGFMLTPPVEWVLPGWGVFITALAVGAAVTAAER